MLLQVISDKKASKNDKPTKTQSLSVSPLTNKNDIFSPKSNSKTPKKDLKSSSEGTIPIHLLKVPLNFKTWSDQRILWNALPSNIHDLGKVWNHVFIMFQTSSSSDAKFSLLYAILMLTLFSKLCLIGMSHFWLLYVHWKKHLLQRVSSIACGIHFILFCLLHIFVDGIISNLFPSFYAIMSIKFEFYLFL